MAKIRRDTNLNTFRDVTDQPTYNTQPVVNKRDNLEYPFYTHHRESSPFDFDPRHRQDKPKSNAKHQRATQFAVISAMDTRKQMEETDSLLNEFSGSNASTGPTKRKGSINNLDLDSGDDDVFESYAVIEFAKNINRNTLYWIIDKIRGKKMHGGAELLLVREPLTSSDRGLTIHVSAAKIKLLELADELGIMKRTKSGVMKNFNVVSLDDFFLNENMRIDDLMTYADRQIIVKHALESIKAQKNERNFPGSEYHTLYHGQSIIEAALDNSMITNIYSLHDQDVLKKLGPSWYRKIFDQPIHQIREYFGESIAIYFAFVGFYTIALVVPTCLGLLQRIFSYEYQALPVFCVFNVVWMTVFTEMWKRRVAILSYKWGTISMTNLDLPRIGYYGKIGKDPVTGKMTPLYPLYKTYTKMYLISWPVISICVMFSGCICMSQFWVEDYIRQLYGADSYLLYLPSVVQSTVVVGLSYVYEYIATWLTDLENHRTQQQYERHRVNKLIILEFVNNFLSLFYIAFMLKDIKMLRSQLMTQLIIVQAFQNLMETLFPVFKQRIFETLDKFLQTNLMKRIKRVDENQLQKDDELYEELFLEKLEMDHSIVNQNRRERYLDEYNSTYEDYLELYVQFGYVVLFSSVAPLAAFWAFLNNILEIRVDAFKLCKMYRRPFAKRAKDTGAWLLAFQVMSLMSIVTNCGIIYLAPQINQLTTTFDDYQWLALMVFLEHMMFIMTWIIHRAIPDCPHWIRVALAKSDYESKQALKRESAQNSKVLLFRRFHSIHEKADKRS